MLADQAPAQTNSSAQAGQKITGIVRGPDGRPASGLPVRIVDNCKALVDTNTDANGRFELNCPQDPDREQYEMERCVLVRDVEHNLAAAQLLEDDSGPLELKLAPGLVLVGSAESGGKPVLAPEARLLFQVDKISVPISGLSRKTSTPGQYEIPALPTGRSYRLYVSAQGYGQASVLSLDTASSAAGRFAAPTVELHPATLKLAGQVLDANNKPAADVEVSFYDAMPSTRADRDGRFFLQNVSQGRINISARTQNAFGFAAVEGGDTNVLLRLNPRPPSRQIQVALTDPKGELVDDGEWMLFLMMDQRWIKVGRTGAFTLKVVDQSWGAPKLLLRSKSRNLAAVQEISADSTNVTVKLEPALMLTGRVQDSEGKPLAGAQPAAYLNLGSVSVGGGTFMPLANLDSRMAPADAQGRYTISCYPAGIRGTVSASAPGYGQAQQGVSPDPDTNRMELLPLVLTKTDSLAAGKVVDAEGKPVPGVNITLNGTGQPFNRAITDLKGQFQLEACEGKIRVYASSPNGSGEISTSAGDTNIVITIAASRPTRPVARRSDLLGAPLPDLAGVNIEAAAVPAGKPVLLCLFDASQRPSRHAVSQLEEQAAALRQKNITLLGLQAAIATDDAFNQWQKDSPVSFPVGRVTDLNAVKAKWASGVSVLPWLILTDTAHRVLAEGFAMEDLDTQIRKILK